MSVYEAVSSDIIKAAPPVGITGSLIAGVPISEWAVVLTVVYTLLMIVYQVIKISRLWKNKNGSE